MSKFLYLSAFAAIGLVGCRHDSDSPAPDTLLGSWRLVKVVCYCAATPAPEEVITFTDGQRFELFRKGQLITAGTYALSRSPACGETTVRDQLSFAVATPGTYAPGGAYSIQNRTLTIDQTNRCFSDGPVYTYQRQ